MTKRSVVSVVRCWDYDEKKVDEAVELSLELIGGLKQKIAKGPQILLKPNCLDASPPDKGVTTHPYVFKACAKVLLKHGARCFFGDSPGLDSPAKALRIAGFESAAKELGVAVSDFYTPVEVSHPDNRLIKKFVVAKAFTDANAVVSLPKMKTHGQTLFTGAVKNMFGIIPGLRKAEFHFKLPDKRDFIQMLVDLYRTTRPFLSVMDAIEGMDGNGPKSGRLRDVGLILASYDAVALDAVACKIVGLNPLEVPLLLACHEQGAGIADLNYIDVLGKQIEDVKVKYFEVAKVVPDMRFLGDFLSQKVKRVFTLRPVINARQCNACYTCMNICPSLPKSIYIKDKEKDKIPQIDYKRCIRCYCCQEVCPRGAIKLYRSVIINIILSIFKFLERKISFH